MKFRRQKPRSRQIHNIKSTSGHTLIEMLIVLTVLVTLTQVTLVYFHGLSRVNQDRTLIDSLSNDLMYAQEWAITHDSDVTVTIDSDEHFYTISAFYFTILKKVTFDKEINFVSGTLKLVVTYNSKGNIVQAGSFYMDTPQNRYKYVFNLGRGRFYVTKL